ncbi:glycoside hydrolase family 43 protein [Alkalicoccus urumqiensis]|uniref:Glycoside hydrolase 43 family protein n=1 Tax=Alkalicoccus urumqiensis TaxID=1548213 RepID=A0A2P6MM15_ALKUR|nr:glycoside hydrolase family 43 protein [Alkalicoccus urumqiensis]PRO67315.1 glycoside hydrolase 43 family protein [Alkalicoccus urumqiensis]
MSMITNPILPGFHADPSILRVGEDFYIATSTFEWFPGVRIHHSRDLKNWSFAGSPLTRTSQLDMKGNMNSGGVWAPDLSWHDGTFYLIYTDVKQWHGAYKDAHNYLVTAPAVTGPWSEPVYLNSSGFDPSLFHDDDGRKYLVNMIWDYRSGNHPFAGIVLQEFDEEAGALTGPIQTIYEGTDIKLTEGPHLYKKDGWYYLLVAEGGTEYEHAETVARAKTIDGPYETDPHYPLLTSRGNPDLTIQKAGHASLVDTPNGEWYLAHLGGRPLNGKYCTLGRETSIQKVVWTDDGWLRLAHGGHFPQAETEAPDLPEVKVDKEPVRDDFNTDVLGGAWNSLRIPADPSWCSLDDRPGHLRLYGRESLSSVHHQSLIARRQTHFACRVQTSVDAVPEDFQQKAGLVVYYDTEDHAYLHVTHHEEKGRVLQILRTVGGDYEEVLLPPQRVAQEGPVELACDIHYDTMQFFYRDAETTDWQPLGKRLDTTHMSDDSAAHVRFTGTFVGMACQDYSGRRMAADFDYFDYEPVE